MKIPKDQNAKKGRLHEGGAARLVSLGWVGIQKGRDYMIVTSTGKILLTISNPWRVLS